jgi:hypothetical protein
LQVVAKGEGIAQQSRNIFVLGCRRSARQGKERTMTAFESERTVRKQDRTNATTDNLDAFRLPVPNRIDRLCADNAPAEMPRSEIPATLRGIVAGLDDDDFDTRQRASARLVKTATLNELTHILNKAEGLTHEQRSRLDRAIQKKAEEVWAQFIKDPKGSMPEARDPKVIEALIKAIPKELQDMLTVRPNSRDSHPEAGPRTATAHLEAVQGLERQAKYCEKFCEWLERAANVPGTPQIAKDMAQFIRTRDGVGLWTDRKAWAAEFHARVADADPKDITDAKNLDKATRDVHAKAFTDTYMELLKSGQATLVSDPFLLLTKRIVMDTTLDEKTYSDIQGKLSRMVLSAPSLGYSQARTLMEILGEARVAQPARQREINRWFDSLSADLEARVAQMRDLGQRFGTQDRIIDVYVATGRKDKAKAMLKTALETRKNIFPGADRDALNRELQAYERRWTRIIEAMK